MAWLKERKRKNPATGKTERYFSIRWRDHLGKYRERALGYMGLREANKRLKVFEGLLATGALLDPEDDVDVPQRSRPSSTPTAAKDEPVAPPSVSGRRLGEYLDTTYLPRAKRNYSAKTMRGFRNQAKALKRRLGDARLDQITFAVLDDYVVERTEEVRTRTVQLELALLRNALKHAVLREELGVMPRLPRVKLTDAKPHRFLTIDETRAILAELDPDRPQTHEVTRGRPPLQRDRYAWLAVLMAVNTGMRRGELLSRKWDDIHWDEGVYGTVFVGDQPDIGFRPKTRRSRVIPLTPELRSALWNARRWSDSEWVFPMRRDPSRPRTSFAKALNNACERAGVERIHIHGLRHSWASRLAQSGVDRRTLMEIGGWKSSQMLDEVYSHVSDDHKIDVMSRMGIEADPDDEEEGEEEEGE